MDFAHQEARKLVNRFSIIAVEDLNVVDMMGNHRLAKSIADVAWSQFAQILVAKAEEAGRRIVRVDPRDTSKACSRCGQLVEKSLSERVHVCPLCGLSLDRDVNAAINILQRGLQRLRL